MNDEPETPGAVFADALQQWREALRLPAPSPMPPRIPEEPRRPAEQPR